MSASMALDDTLFESTQMKSGFPSKVKNLSWIEASVVQVQLSMPADFPRFHPGQYIELALEDGTTRPFSIANYQPQSEEIELHIEARPDSQATWRMVSQMQKSGEISVYPAKGSVQLKPAIGPQVFLAAGTGFAQIKALMEQYLHRCQSMINDQFPIYLFWGSEQPEQRYLEKQVEVWCRHHKNLRYLPLNWQNGDCWGKAVSAKVEQLKHSQIYACGSPWRIYQTLDVLERQGVSATQIQSDVFSYAPRPSKKATKTVI